MALRAVEYRTASVLQAQVVEEMITGRLSFVYLPRTYDLLAFDTDGGGAAPPKIEHLQNVAQAPVPDRVAGLGKFAMLAERVRDRAVSNLPDDVREVVTPEKGDEFLTAECPSFHCAGSILEQDGAATIHLNLYG